MKRSRAGMKGTLVIYGLLILLFLLMYWAAQTIRVMPFTKTLETGKLGVLPSGLLLDESRRTRIASTDDGAPVATSEPPGLKKKTPSPAPLTATPRPTGPLPTDPQPTARPTTGPPTAVVSPTATKKPSPRPTHERHLDPATATAPPYPVTRTVTPTVTATEVKLSLPSPQATNFIVIVYVTPAAQPTVTPAVDENSAHFQVESIWRFCVIAIFLMGVMSLLLHKLNNQRS